MDDILKLSWDNIDFLTQCLVEQIKSRNMQFDCIIALGRGGLIPGAALSYKLNIKTLYNIGINTRQENGKYIDTIVYQRPDSIKESSKILVIDDINDSGRTFTAVNSILNRNYKVNSDSILYASLIKREGTEFNTNIISGNTLHTTRWLQFPWDK